jgi:hypothetical protein
MLKMVSAKSTLLLGVVMALCAFVLPAAASAGSWSHVGTTDGRFDSGNLGFSVPAVGAGAACTASTLSVTVHSAAVATITGASFVNCHGNVGSAFGCTTTATGTNFPWRVTPTDTTRIEIHDLDIDVRFETTPGTLNECVHTGANIRLTGTVVASFTPSDVAFSRRFDFTGSTGLFTHIPGLGTLPAAMTGNATPTNLLNIIM